MRNFNFNLISDTIIKHHKLVLALLFLYTINLSPVIGQREWGPWQAFDNPCFSGLQFRTKRGIGACDPPNSPCNWWLQIKNNYNKTVHLSTILVEAHREAEIRESGKTTDRFTIQPGKKGGIYFYIDTKDKTFAWVNNVRLGKDVGPYWGCDAANNLVPLEEETNLNNNGNDGDSNNDTTETEHSSNSNSSTPPQPTYPQKWTDWQPFNSCYASIKIRSRVAKPNGEHAYYMEYQLKNEYQERIYFDFQTARDQLGIGDRIKNRVQIGSHQTVSETHVHHYGVNYYTKMERVRLGSQDSGAFVACDNEREMNSSTQNKSIKELVEEGEHFYKKGDLDAAEKKFQDASAQYTQMDYRQRTKEMDGSYQWAEIRLGNIRLARKNGGKIPGTNHYVNTSQSNHQSSKPKTKTIEDHRASYDNLISEIDEREKMKQQMDAQRSELNRKKEATFRKIRSVSDEDWGHASTPMEIMREAENKLAEINRDAKNDLSAFHEKYEERQAQSQALSSTYSNPKDAAEMEFVSGVLNIIGAAVETSHEKKERERARNAVLAEQKRRLRVFVSQKMEELKASATMSIQKAAYSEDATLEEYYYNLYKYSNCQYDDFDMALNKNKYQDSHCYEPTKPSYTSTNIPPYRDIAIRKWKIYQEDPSVELFGVAAKEFMELAMQEEPENPLNYEYYAEYMSHSAAEKIKYYKMASVLSGNPNQYKHEIKQTIAAVSVDLSVAVEQEDYMAVADIFDSKLYQPNSKDEQIAVLQTCIKNDDTDLFILCDNYFDRINKKLTKKDEAKLMTYVFRYDALEMYEMIAGSSNLSKDDNLFRAVELESKSIAHHLVASSTIHQIKQVFERLKVDKRSGGAEFLAKCVLEAGTDNNNIELIDLALEKGVSIKNTIDDKGNTLVYRSILKKDFQETKALLKNRALRRQIHQANKRGWYPLHLAVWKGDTEMVEQLLSLGADSNVSGEKGWTPLHYAVKEQNLAMVKILLRYRANANIKDEHGFSPYKMSKRLRLKNFKKLLK